MSNSEFIYNRNHPLYRVPFSTVHPPYNKREVEARIYPAMKAVEQTKMFIKDCYGLDGHPVLDRHQSLWTVAPQMCSAAEVNDFAIHLMELISQQTPLIRKKEKAYAAE